MVRAWLFGVVAMAVAASGAEAKGPQCHDAKGHAVPCRHARAPEPTPPPSDDGCLWLITHGILAPCTIV